MLELVKQFEKSSGKTVTCDLVERREGDVAKLVCDASLAAKELNWVPKRTVKDMCECFFLNYSFSFLIFISV